MAATPEELAFELSRATFEGTATTGKVLRKRAAGLLSAASVVIPVAAIAVHGGPAGVALPFGLAAIAYGMCAYFCGRALVPKEFQPGIAGFAFLELARKTGANLAQMYGTAASYLDQAQAANSETVSECGDDIETAIRWLVVELALLAASLVVTILA